MSNSPHPRDFRQGWDRYTKHTRCIIEFYTWEENGPSGRTDDPRVRAKVGYPVRVTHSKMFGQASGNFTITMKKPEDVSEYAYQTMWRDPEGVYVRILWQCDGTVIGGMLGCVDTVNATIVRSEMGTRDETYEINGRDIGKVFEDTLLFINPFSAVDVEQYAFISETLQPTLIGQPPSVFVTSLIDAWIGNREASRQAFELPAGLKEFGDTLYAMISYAGVEDMTIRDNGFTSDVRLLDPAQTGTSLWDALQHYSNGVMNEMWIDLAPSVSQPYDLANLVPTLYLRERPFPTQESNDKWSRTRGWTLDRSDIQRRQVAKGGSAARFNYWMLFPGGFGAPELSGFCQQNGTGEPGSMPIVDYRSISRFGLRKWEQTTLFVPANIGTDNTEKVADFTEVPTEAWVDLLKAWLKKIHDWYVIAPMQLSGQIATSRLYPEIRIGHRLREETAEGYLEYYVEGVENTWQYPGSGTTILTVTRGQHEDDNLLNSVYVDRFFRPEALDVTVGERDPVDE